MKRVYSLLLAISIIGVAASALTFTSASADFSGASTSASVRSVPTCDYSISGVSSSISLTPSGDYNPDKIGSTVLTGADPSIVISGYPGGVLGAECSFYGSAPTGPKMKVNLGSSLLWSSNCVGSGCGSTKLEWSTSSSNPISVAATQSTAGSGDTRTDCSSGGISLNSTSLTNTTPATLISIVASTPKQCDANIAVSTTIPSGINYPAGQHTYTITGPTLIFTYGV
ncbi:MAG: hypothetical protein RL414_56 [Actinomycetota bacterium]|jgi:hypothetical protein